VNFESRSTIRVAERFVQSIERECLDRLVLLGPDHLPRALKIFVDHYHLERPHQGLGNRFLTPRAAPAGGGDALADEEN